MDESHHIPILFYVFAFVALAFFFYNLRLLWTVRVGKEEKYRPTNWLSRITNALTFGVGQRKVMNRRFTYATVMHFLSGVGLHRALLRHHRGLLCRPWLVRGVLPARTRLGLRP